MKKITEKLFNRDAILGYAIACIDILIIVIWQ